MSRNRRFLDGDSDDDDAGWSRTQKSTAQPSRRNGVSRDPLAEVRAIILGEWRETTSDAYHPVTLALDMLDRSSLGRHKDLRKFQQTNEIVEQALQSTVNEHYQGFNTSIGFYGQFSTSVIESRHKLRSAKESLARAKIQLSVRRGDLLDMSYRSQQLKNVVKLLRDITVVRQIPDELEFHLSAKAFINAVQCLNDATSMSNREDMLEIPALNDIRQYLKSQSLSIVEILLEELHNHLYLKSIHCESQWSPYRPGQVELQPLSSVYNKAGSTHFNVSQFAMTSEEAQRLLRPNASRNRESNIEADSSRYLATLISALDMLGKVPYAVDLVSQRIQPEIRQIVERTITEVQQRHKDILYDSAIGDDFLSTDLDDQGREPLRDLLWTLFSKWSAILQAHRIMYELIAASNMQEVAKPHRRQQSLPNPYRFSEIWHCIENELRSLLDAHLMEESGSQGSGLGIATDELFDDRPVRDKSLPIFSIMKTSSQSENVLGNDELELHKMLQGSVPGLLPENEDIIQTAKITATSDKGPSKVGIPTPFNISVMLQPTIVFLHRAKRILPAAKGADSIDVVSFLDEYLEDVFAPQIAQTVDAIYHRNMGSSEHTAPAQIMSNQQEGVASSTESLLKLIDGLRSLISSIPYNRENYAHPILSVMGKYYTQCHAWLMNLTANEHIGEGSLGSLKVGAAWAHRPIVRDLWANYFSREHDQPTLVAAVLEERRALYELKKGVTLRAHDLLQDSNSLESLMLLYRSLKHFINQVLSIRPPNSERPCPPAFLQMREQSLTHFDTLIKSYTQLTQTILLVIRIELRCHVLYYMQLSLGQGNYNIEEPASEVDSFLTDLNADLLAICQPASTLPEADYNFVMTGLTDLIEDVLVNDADTISIMTREGAAKLALGIAALQQNLRNLVPNPSEADLGKARHFYELFELGPLGLVDAAGSKDLGFSFGQLSKMMVLMYSLELASAPPSSRGNRDSVSARRKQLNDHLSLLQTSMAERLAE